MRRTASALRDLHLIRVFRDEQHALLHRMGSGTLERPFGLDLSLDLLDGLRHLVHQHRTRLRIHRCRHIDSGIHCNMRVVRHCRECRRHPGQYQTGGKS